MDLTELEIFCAVAQSRSITRAATQLKRVQSNVTTRVKQLEHDLGVPLFVRGSRGMTLTPAGERLHGYAQKILSIAREARHAVRSTGPSGVLRVGTVESIAELWLPCVIGTYHQRWSDVRLEVSTGTSRVLADQVRHGAIECALLAQIACAHGEADPAVDLLIGEPGLRATKVGADELLAVLPAMRSARAGAARHYAIATTAEGRDYRALAHGWLAGAGVDIDPQHELIELSSYPALLMSSMAGDVVGLFPKSVLERLVLPRGTTAVLLASLNVYLVSRADFTSSAFDELVRLMPAGRRRDKSLSA